MHEEKYHPTNWVTERSIDFLRRRDPGKPFFLMASYLRPHPPFDAPRHYFDLYRDQELRLPYVGTWETDELLKRDGRIYDSKTGPIDAELIRQAQVGYYACITHLDPVSYTHLDVYKRQLRERRRYMRIFCCKRAWFREYHGIDTYRKNYCLSQFLQNGTGVSEWRV